MTKKTAIKIKKYFFLLSFVIITFLFSSCSVTKNRNIKSTHKDEVYFWKEHQNNLIDKDVDNGIPVFNDSLTVKYTSSNQTNYFINLEQPLLVYQAQKKQNWGFVQFPRIFKNVDGKIAIIWSMNPDDIRSKSKRKWKYSKDNGKTWFIRHKEFPQKKGVQINNEEHLNFYSKNYKDTIVNTIAPEIKSKGTDQSNFNNKHFKFYLVNNLPDSLLNFNYIISIKTSKEKKRGKVKYFENTLKYSYKGIFPNQLWGKVSKTKNNKLITCQYPYFKIAPDGSIPQSGIAFFESLNNGLDWNQLSEIPFKTDNNFDIDNSERNYLGFTEPVFQELKDGRIICVMRSSPNDKPAPMYMSVSNDSGKKWTSPERITHNGVLPQLLLLDNNIVVMSSGRPGVQIRFLNANNKDLVWSDPIEMIPFKNIKGQVSCGYTGLLALSKDSFLITYSDFKTRDEQNNIRKSIFVRKISINFE